MLNYRYRDTVLKAPFDKAFDYIAEPSNLPSWTEAFESASSRSATLRTPDGVVDIGLDIQASRQRGTIDWIMTFPDGSGATAYSRLTELNDGQSYYGFVLTPPPAPLEALEGALDQQATILERELVRLGEELAR